MKWRHSLIYLIVLVLIGGYYYYFEVVRKDQREAAARLAKQVFHFQVAKVRGLDLWSKDKHAVRLVKKKHWQIVAPVQAQVDEPTLQGMLSTLSTLHMERTVVAKAKDLQPYGLQHPVLTVRLRIGNQWRELALGSRNPAGDGYYAKTGAQPKVFLVSEGIWGILHKGVNDLRRRELFTFHPDQVTAMRVSWQNGDVVHVEQQPKTHAWVAPESPQLKISSTKVVNVLDQILYLQANKFLQEKPQDLNKYGLTTPEATVKLRLKNARTVELQLAKQTAGENQIAALSSQLPAVVQIDAGIYKELPKTVRNLENRSLVAFQTTDVQRIDWRTKRQSRQWAASGADRWSVQVGSAAPTKLKDGWSVEALLYDVKQAEYTKVLRPAPNPSAQPENRLEFWNKQKQPLGALIWDNLAQANPVEGKSGLVTVWLKKSGQSRAVQVKANVIERIAKDLQAITPKPAKSSRS